MPHELEICIACDSLEDALRNARAASDGGADRLECCAAMDAGGLTPEATIIAAIRNAIPSRVAVLAMVRPRDGGFEWSAHEANQLKQTTRDMVAAGADGIVSGALRDGAVDEDVTESLIDIAHGAGKAFTFHRALDAATDRYEALATLVTLGCDRVLTAGTPWGSGSDAAEGITELVRAARLLHGRMEIVVGGGVSAGTLPRLMEELRGLDGISFHAYSSVMSAGFTTSDNVSALRSLIYA